MDSSLWPLIIALVALLTLDVTALRWGHDSQPGPDADPDRSQRTGA